MKCEHTSGSLRLTVHDYEQDKASAIVRNKLIPALFLPGITFCKCLSKGFPVWYVESLHIPVPPVLSQFAFLIHILAVTAGNRTLPHLGQ